MKSILTTILFAVSASSIAQTVVLTTKPMFSGWTPLDIAGTEIQLIGRKGTDVATAHKIIGRIAVKTLDFSLLTQRVTILVPANEVWEVKSLAVKSTPLNTTNIKPLTVETADFASSFFPTPGQVLAIDVNTKTGDIMMGPVSVPIPVPTPAPVTCIKLPPALQIVEMPSGVWTSGPPDPDGVLLGQFAIFRNGVKVKGSVNYAAQDSTGAIYNFDPLPPAGTGAGWEKWNGTGWTALAAAPAGC
jgi:hypothetical protein